MSNSNDWLHTNVLVKVTLADDMIDVIDVTVVYKGI